MIIKKDIIKMVSFAKKHTKIFSIVLAVIMLVSALSLAASAACNTYDVNASVITANFGTMANDAQFKSDVEKATVTLAHYAGSKLVSKQVYTLKEFLGYKGLDCGIAGPITVDAGNTLKVTVNTDACERYDFTFNGNYQVRTNTATQAICTNCPVSSTKTMTFDTNGATGKMKNGLKLSVSGDFILNWCYKPVLDVKVSFPVYSKVNFDNISATALKATFFRVYKLVNGKYTLVDTIKLKDMKDFDGYGCVALSEGKYKVIRSYPTAINGYKVSYTNGWFTSDYNRNWLNATKPTGWKNNVFYFEAKDNEVYTYSVAITVY